MHLGSSAKQSISTNSQNTALSSQARLGTSSFEFFGSGDSASYNTLATIPS